MKRGLGDTVASWTKKLGLSECGGCSRRREKLNRWFPYLGQEGRAGKMATAIGDHSRQRRRTPVNDAVTVIDTASVTVTTPTLGQCPPGAIFCEDWETGLTQDTDGSILATEMSAKGWIWNSAWDCLSAVSPCDLPSGEKRTCFLGVGGFNSTANSFQNWICEDRAESAFPDHNFTGVSGSIFARFYINYMPGFKFNPGFSGGKVAYFRSLNSPQSNDWRVHIAELDVAGANDLFTHYEFDLRHMEVFDVEFVNQNRIFFPYNQGNDVNIEADRWYSVEMELRPNTPTTDILSDGIMRMWIDGVLVIEYTDVNMRYNLTSISNDLWLTHNFGGGNTTHPAQWVKYDNIVIDDAAIGP